MNRQDLERENRNLLGLPLRVIRISKQENKLMTFYNYKTFVKSIKLITLLSLTVVFLSSCDDNDYPYYGGGDPYYNDPLHNDPFYRDPFNTGHPPWNHPGGNYLDYRRRSNPRGEVPNVQIGQQQATQLLERLYQGILFRPSDPQGMHLYVGRVVQGGLHELARVAETMARGREFYERVANRRSPQEILNNLYIKIFDREVDAGGQQEYFSEIPRNTYKVVKYMVLSPEFSHRHL